MPAQLAIVVSPIFWYTTDIGIFKEAAMLATLIPLFDKNLKVSAYSIFAQKKNFLLNPSYLGTGSNDGAVAVNGLDLIHAVGIDTLSPGTDVFVPVNNIAIFTDIENQCKAPHKRIALLFDNTITCEDSYVNRLKQLKSSGFKLAIRKLKISEYEPMKKVLDCMDYILLDSKYVDVKKAKIYFTHQYPNIRMCAGNIDSQDMFEDLNKDPAFCMFEGSFYRLPVTRGEHTIAPLKINYLELLDMVNTPDFDLTKAADVISRDTALVVSLLKIVNVMSRNSEITSIRHAAAMLGQKELKKWINVAVTKELCTDRPGEITRISLLRAKFAEQLAPLFNMAGKSPELLLMGLFSVLDLILELPMAEALKKVNVSKEITDALVKHKGELAPVIDFIKSYESADWQEVSRQMILLDIDMDDLYDAYIRSLCWYRDLFAS